MHSKHAIARQWAATHGGVVTQEMLDTWGYTSNEIKGRVRRHGWVGLGRGAYRIVPARDHWDLVRSAVSVLENAVASHETAAEIHGIGRVSKGRAVVTVHSRTTHTFAGVVVHRTHDLDDDHICPGEIPVTTPERTIVDLAGSRRPAHIASIVDDLVSTDTIDLMTLSRVAQSVARRGKPGSRTMRSVLEPRVGNKRPQSELERRARRLIADARLPEPVSEYAIPWAPERRFDDAYPVAKLALEWDSRRYHGQFAAFEADRRRDREATLHGWRVIRFTWSDVVDRPDLVVRTIEALLGGSRTGS